MTDTETSHALPAYCYQDPAKVVENNQLHSLGCRACKHHSTTLGKVYCANTKVPIQILKRVPSIGRGCKQFEFKG